MRARRLAVAGSVGDNIVQRHVAGLETTYLPSKAHFSVAVSNQTWG